MKKITDFDLKGKKVIVRADLDFDPKDTKNLRLTSLIPTLDYLKNQNTTITIIGHRGRPTFAEASAGKPEFSLKLFQPYFQKWNAKVLENLRFDPGEEANDPEFAKKLADLGDFYINEAFAASHRAHASIVGLPKLLPHAAGLRFAQEVENLSKVFKNPKRPVLAIISGVKKDKLDYLGDFKKFCDKILIAGRLPEFLGDDFSDPVVMVAKLVPDKEDITIHSIENFEKEIAGAKTIVLSGPIGKFEDEGHKQGTRRVFEAVAKSSAFKVAGGGDTEQALKVLSLSKDFDWISVGGGAMLEFLARGTLPGIEALLK